MSFTNQNFSVMAYANGFTLWNYSTTETLANTKAEGYFNDVATFARVGDMILVVANKDADVAAAIFVVASINNGVVVVKSFAAA